MSDDFEQPEKLAGDTREYYPNRPVAQTAANRGQETYSDQGVYSATAQFEPNKGFVAVLFSDANIPDAWKAGFEVKVMDQIQDKTPSDWASKKSEAKSGADNSGGGRPAKGATARVWAIAEDTAAGRGDRAKVIAACEEAGINKSTAATQWSKFAKSKGW